MKDIRLPTHKWAEDITQGFAKKATLLSSISDTAFVYLFKTVDQRDVAYREISRWSADVGVDHYRYRNPIKFMLRPDVEEQSDKYLGALKHIWNALYGTQIKCNDFERVSDLFREQVEEREETGRDSDKPQTDYGEPGL